MHTDEFEIALSRELKVCENTIKRINTTLGMMERKYHKTTAVFIQERRSARPDDNGDNKDDYRVWENSHESLERWQDLERQYREQYRIMKI